MKATFRKYDFSAVGCSARYSERPAVFQTKAISFKSPRRRGSGPFKSRKTAMRRPSNVSIQHSTDTPAAFRSAPLSPHSKHTVMQFTPYRPSRQRSGFHYVLLTICQVLMCTREFDCGPHPAFDVPDVNVAPHLFTYCLATNSPKP